MVRKLKSCGRKPEFEYQEFDGNHSYTENSMTKPTKRRDNKERIEKAEFCKRKLTPQLIPKIAHKRVLKYSLII